ncbi:hypothetical protein SuNHUV7_40590 (plasmid) [Pseudoseohaeicola sp. NH-UV-7]
MIAAPTWPLRYVLETLITQSEPSIPELLFGGGTPRKAAMTALVVGTVLTGINHGDAILAGDYPPVVKVILTYCVPYCVTSWGAATGKLAQYRDNQARAVLRQERRK